MTNPGHHFVAVIRGAISGSVAAGFWPTTEFRVAVFEQNTRPYGKIEDGLPVGTSSSANRNTLESTRV